MARLETPLLPYTRSHPGTPTPVQDGLAVEEDAKRRMLLRYIHAVKEHAAALAEQGSGGVLQLPESNISDEEVHALAALLRNNTTIEELNLRGNNITDDGARALGAVLAGRSSLRLVDLRGNKIGKGAIRILAEALERAERVRHVYVHAGGKIEALGTAARGGTGMGMGSSGAIGEDGEGGDAGARAAVNVETICVVDVRDNNPHEAQAAYELLTQDARFDAGLTAGEPLRRGEPPKFTPLMLLESNGVAPKGGWDASTVVPPSLLTNGGLGSSVKDKDKDGPGKKKAKKAKKTAAGAGSETEQSDAEKKRHKAKLHEDKILALKEQLWQGRAGTLDQGHAGGADLPPPGGAKPKKDFNAKLKKRAQRGELPPLTEGFVDGERGRSAPESLSRPGTAGLALSQESDERVMSAIIRARQRAAGSGKHVYEPLSETEIGLFASPYGKPVVDLKPLPSIGHGRSHSHSSSPSRSRAAGGGAGTSVSPERSLSPSMRLHASPDHGATAASIAHMGGHPGGGH